MTLEEMFIYFQKEFGITQEESLSHFPMFISLKNKKVVVIGGEGLPQEESRFLYAMARSWL